MSDVSNSREVYCRLEGWLYKLKRNHASSILPQWNKRYFTIEGMYLKWYKSSTSSLASNFINILEIEKVSNFEHVNGIYSFIIVHPTRNLMLRASSAGELNKWIQSIQSQIDIYTKKDNKSNVSSSLEAQLDVIFTSLDKLQQSVSNNINISNSDSHKIESITSNANSSSNNTVRIITQPKSISPMRSIAKDVEKIKVKRVW